MLTSGTRTLALLFCLALAPSAAADPLTLSLRLTGALDDNPLRVGDGLPLPDGLDRHRDRRLDVELGAATVVQPAPALMLVLSTGLGWRRHRRLEALEHVVLAPQASLNLRLGERVVAQLGGGLTDVRAAGGRRHQQAEGVVRLLWAPTALPGSTTTLSLHQALTRVADGADARFDRSGASTTIGLSEQLRVPGTALSVSVDLERTWHRTRGREDERTEDRVRLTLAHPLPLGVEGALTLSATRARYAHSSLQVPGPRRRDDVSLDAELWLSRRLGRGVRVFVALGVRRVRSARPAFDHDRRRLLVGVELTY